MSLNEFLKGIGVFQQGIGCSGLWIMSRQGRNADVNKELPVEFF